MRIRVWAWVSARAQKSVPARARTQVHACVPEQYRLLGNDPSLARRAAPELTPRNLHSMASADGRPKAFPSAGGRSPLAPTSLSNCALPTVARSPADNAVLIAAASTTTGSGATVVL